ncbi:MAG: RNA polymerase-binding protein DksA, partial [Methyloprofundus sp.]|nr:RNA polymerase-binding protein DksA [Methyloprofundus sp.]
MTNSTSADSTPFNFTPYTEKEGEEFMNDAQKEHFRGILTNWKSELMHEVDR